jgi:hypothetical protein
MRCEAERPRPVDGSGHDEVIVPDDGVGHSREEGVTGLGGLGDGAAAAILQALPDARRDLVGDAEPLQDAEGVGIGRFVGRGGPGGDDVQRIADDVGQEERVHRRPAGGPGELAALEYRAVLPHRVELIDGGARPEKEAGERLLLLQRDGRRRRGGERRAAARDQDQQQVVGACGSGEVVDGAGGRRPARVGHRVAGLEQPHPARRGKMAVLDGDDAVDDPVAQHLLGRCGHRARGLPGADHQHSAVGWHDAPAGWKGETRESTLDERAHIPGPERGIEDRAGRLPKRHRASFWSRRPASMSMSSVLGKQKRILVRPRSPCA